MMIQMIWLLQLTCNIYTESPNLTVPLKRSYFYFIFQHLWKVGSAEIDPLKMFSELHLHNSVVLVGVFAFNFLFKYSAMIENIKKSLKMFWWPWTSHFARSWPSLTTDRLNNVKWNWTDATFPSTLIQLCSSSSKLFTICASLYFLP